MRFKVSLRKKDIYHEEIVISNNKEEAEKIALKNNPESEVEESTWTYKL